MSGRKRVIYVTSRFPYPPHSGEKVRSYELLQILRKHFDVHLICQNEVPIKPEHRKFVTEQVLSFHLIVRNKWLNRIHALKAFFNGKPLQVNYFYDQRVSDCIAQLENQVGGIVCSLARTAEYGRQTKVKKCLDMIDSIGQNYINSYPRTTSLFWKLIYLFEGERLFNYEKQVVKEFDSTFFVNKSEMLPFHKLGHIGWAPNGVSNRVMALNDLKIESEYQSDVCFFGKMDYRPNIEACIWFAKNVLPRLAQEIRFVIVGVGPTPEITDLQKELGHRIVIKGFIENPYGLIKSCLCLVAPMQTGAGMQNKVLESMGIGQVVIASSLAAKAIIGVEAGENIYVEDDPMHFANRIHELLHLRRKNTRNLAMIAKAREFVEQQYNWKQLDEKTVGFLEIQVNA